MYYVDFIVTLVTDFSVVRIKDECFKFFTSHQGILSKFGDISITQIKIFFNRYLKLDR